MNISAQWIVKIGKDIEKYKYLCFSIEGHDLVVLVNFVAFKITDSIV